ncbi:MAG: hypothetical protein HYX63_24125 [Gammaproteobacteria bacterium]|nr:hypothetical protein [Gammaproteobacteria bacterium]
MVKFASEATLQTWDVSAQRRQWHHRMSAVAEGDPDYQWLTGLEAWFRLPSIPSGRPPKRSAWLP